MDIICVNKKIKNVVRSMCSLAVLLIAAASMTAYADVYKCIKDNKVVFQDVECGTNTKVFGAM